MFSENQMCIVNELMNSLVDPGFSPHYDETLTLTPSFYFSSRRGESLGMRLPMKKLTLQSQNLIPPGQVVVQIEEARLLQPLRIILKKMALWMNPINSHLVL